MANHDVDNVTLQQTISLADYEVPIHLLVREILTSQLLAHHDGSQPAAERHVSELLEALKRPPLVSYCRAVGAQRHQVVESIQRQLKEMWSIEESVKAEVRPHEVYEDVIQILVHSDEPSLSSCSVPPLSGDSICLFDGWATRRDRGWPLTHRVVIVDRFCAEAVLRGSHIFRKGILVADASITKNQVVAVYAHVKDETKPIRGLLMNKYMKQLEDRKEHSHSCLFLGLGRVHCNRAQFYESDASGIGISLLPQRAGPLLPPLSGLSNIYAQNFPSILVGYALDPHPGDFILDMCCAPGGKTTHLAQLVQNTGTIVACDKSRVKILAMRELVKDFSSIVALALDTTTCVNENESLTVREVLDRASKAPDGLLEVEGFAPESFDRILLDPPCSALGVRPKLAITTLPRELKMQAEYQRRFIKQAVRLLKPGGILTYSTCTFNTLENECNAAYMLSPEFGLTLLPLEGTAGQMGLKGHGLDDVQRTCVRRFDPSSEADDSMGFFIAKFKKNKPSQ
jgi:predicted ribosome-associated RNA-binding protein Tma20/SAM-dependent methyltransferase